jgi:hypothetical protein
MTEGAALSYIKITPLSRVYYSALKLLTRYSYVLPRSLLKD